MAIFIKSKSIIAYTNVLIFEQHKKARMLLSNRIEIYIYYIITSYYLFC